MNRLRVALALDNTGSMASDGKIGALKTATKSLLDQLKAAAANNGDVYVSIIPFNKNVNVGTSTYYQCQLGRLGRLGRRQRPRPVDHDLHDARRAARAASRRRSARPRPTWVPDNHNTWNGCITDRDKNYDVTGTAPVDRHRRHAVPGRAVRQLPGADEGPELRLDRA